MASPRPEPWMALGSVWKILADQLSRETGRSRRSSVRLGGLCLDSVLESLQVCWHLPGGLSPDDQRDEELADAVALEVDGDADA